MTLQEIAGVISGALSLLAAVPYLLGIFGRTITLQCLKPPVRPSRVTWIILSGVSLVLVACYRSSGAGQTLWLPAALAATCSTVAIISLFRGQDGLHSWDLLCAALGMTALVLLAVSRMPRSALLLACTAEFFGLLPTIRKSLQCPNSECGLAWTIALLASALNVLAVDRWTVAIAAYPIYLMITNGIVVMALLVGSQAKSRTRVIP